MNQSTTHNRNLDRHPSEIDSETRPLEFRDYHAPCQHGESFVEPAFEEALPLLESNRQLLSDHVIFESLRERARRQLIEDAMHYTSVYRNTDWLDGESLDAIAQRPILMAGHQPALFHPGVWFKNFALSQVAQQTGSVAVNLVIDNDVASGSSIRVPRLDPETLDAAYEAVPYDDAGGGVPYEQTTIHNQKLFDQFDDEVKRVVAALVEKPCVDQLWNHAKTAIERCGVAGCALAQARHGLEGELGLQTLELPLGVVCRTTAFAEFVLSILTELPRFQRCYNLAADEYRQHHGIRSTAHPVPNLAEQEGWFEAPLWIYGNQSPVRRPVWVRLLDDHLVITDREEREVKIDIRYPRLAAEKLTSMITPDFKLRPRALLTTMYARLILSDLFMHGIGGAKYDQLGDRIIRSFFMVEPPRFMVMSATVQLPGIKSEDHASKVRQLKRQLRETFFQPERFADTTELDETLIARKRELLVNLPPRGHRSEWHGEITEINRQLAGCLEGRRHALVAELAKAQLAVASQTLLASREHPFCVFPVDYLQDTFSHLLRGPQPAH